MAGILKWLQALGVGALGAIYAYVQAQGPSGEGIEAVLTGLGLTLLVKGLGWLVAQVGSVKPVSVPTEALPAVQAAVEKAQG